MVAGWVGNMSVHPFSYTNIQVDPHSKCKAVAAVPRPGLMWKSVVV